MAKDSDSPKKDEGLQQISERKIIYIEIDEEITAIFDRIKTLRYKDIYVVVPKRSMLLQSIVNLKILKRKLDDIDKNLYIITNDKTGTKLAQQIGIPVYDRITKDHKIPLKPKEPKENMVVPITATKNVIEKETPKRIKGKKMSILDVVRIERGKKGKVSIRLPRFGFGRKKKKKMDESKPQDMKTALRLEAPNRHVIATLIVISVLLLFVISYIALPGATIYLTPKANVLERTVNVTLADARKNAGILQTHPANTIATYPVTTTVRLTKTYYATGKEFQGKNASGTVTLINKSENDWPLLAKTRLQTDDGLVFRTPRYLVVPAAKDGKDGTLEVRVIADEFDVAEQVIGERGNIPPTTFFLPGLRESNRKQLYAESTEPMTGGETIVSKKVTKEDLDSANMKMETELKNAAEAELLAYTDEKNKEQNTNFKLLTGANSIKMGTPLITVPFELEGQEIEKFEVSGEMEATGVTFNYNELVNILKNELKLRKSPQKKLLEINEDTINYRIFKEEVNAGKFYISAIIRGIEQYEIDPTTENGARFIKKIREHILGEEVKEALNDIQNLSEINRVEIRSWPIWAPTIPTVPENIEFTIVEEE